MTRQHKRCERGPPTSRMRSLPISTTRKEPVLNPLISAHRASKKGRRYAHTPRPLATLP